MGKAATIGPFEQQMRDAVRDFAPMPEPVRDALLSYCKALRADADAGIAVLLADVAPVRSIGLGDCGCSDDCFTCAEPGCPRAALLAQTA